MDKEELMFLYWRDKLGLNDWTIRFKYNVAHDDMNEPEAVGCVTYEESIKTALIQILNPDHYGDRIAPFDVEKTIVHELLHIKMCLATIEKDTVQERVMHQLIDDLAKTMVNARRENKITKEMITKWEGEIK